MITDEDAKKLVGDLRALAKRNKGERDEYDNAYWRGRSDGRVGAYSLAAEWLEKLIVPDEEADDVQVS